MQRPASLWRRDGSHGTGRITGVAGEGPGRDNGQFAESNYIVMDKRGNLYVGDTGVTRVTMMAPRC